MVGVKRVVEPSQSVRDVYDALFHVYREAYERMADAGLYRSIYDFQNLWF